MNQTEPPSEPPLPILEVTKLKKLFAGNTELLDRLIGISREQLPGFLKDIQSAADLDDWETVRKTCHSLRGSLVNLGSVEALEVASRVEHFAREAEVAECRENIPHLCEAVQRFQQELERVDWSED